MKICFKHQATTVDFLLSAFTIFLRLRYSLICWFEIFMIYCRNSYKFVCSFSYAFFKAAIQSSNAFSFAVNSIILQTLLLIRVVYFQESGSFVNTRVSRLSSLMQQEEPDPSPKNCWEAAFFDCRIQILLSQIRLHDFRKVI